MAKKPYTKQSNAMNTRLKFIDILNKETYELFLERFIRSLNLKVSRLFGEDKAKKIISLLKNKRFQAF